MKRSPLLLALLLAGSCGSPPPPKPKKPASPFELVAAGLPPPTPLLPSPPGDAPPSFQGALPSGLSWAGAVLKDQTLERVVIRLSPLGSPIPRWRPALAALSLVEGGALNLRGEAYTLAVEALGGRIRGDWRDGAMELTLEIPPANLAPGLLRLEQLILTPAYERFALARGLKELERRIRTWPVLASPGGNMPPTGEGLPTSEEDIPSPLEMRDWHSKAFHPRWTALAFCGPLSRKKIQEALDRTMALWQDPRPAPIPPMPSFPQPGLFWSDRARARPTLLSLFLPLGSLGSPWWGPFRVLSRVLSGERGEGRLPAALQAGGIAFDSYRSRVLHLAPNLALRIYQVEGIPPESLPRALEIVVDTLGGLTQNPITRTEAQRARLGALAEEALVCRDPSRLLPRLLQVAATPGGVAQQTPPLQALREALVRTTLSDLRRAAPAFLPNRAWILAQGPREARRGSAFSRAMILAGEPEIPGTSKEPPPAPLPEGKARAQEIARARALLSQAVRALGGPSLLGRLESLEITATFLWPGGFRERQTWKISQEGLERTRRVLGTTVRFILPEGSLSGKMVSGGKTLPMPPESVELLKGDLESDPLWFLSRLDPAKAQARIVGTEDFQGVSLVRILLGERGPKAVYLSIDPRSGLVRVMDHFLPGGRVRDTFQDYREVGNLRHPYLVERFRRGEKTWTMEVEDLRVKISGEGRK